MAFTFNQARDKALEKGGTTAEIDRQAVGLTREVGTVPFNNMIRALNIHPWGNDRDQWIRLAAALKARRERRR
jgi:hypothetical protein